MKISKKLFFLIILFYSIALFPQKYKLSGIIKNSEQNKLIFSKYNFNNKEFIDTVHIKNDKILYDISNLESGMYNLENKTISIDFIYNAENIDIDYDGKNTNFNKSIENKLITNFFNFYENNNLAYNLLNQLERYYPKSDEFYTKIVQKRNLLIQKNDNYIDSISNKYPKSFASTIIKLYGNKNSDFLDSSLFYDTNLKNTNFLGDLIISYINTYQKQSYTKEQQENAFKPAIDTIFNSLNKNPELCIYISEFLIDQFRYYDFDLISEYIALKASEYNNSCIDDEKLKEKLNNIESILNVKLGKEAPNFQITKDISLHDIKSDYKLVIFWASWCPHCEKLLDEMIEKQANLSDNVTIITYSLDYDKTDWENKIKTFPASWINRCLCTDSNENIPDSYAIYSTPAIFLLDETNTIIEKPINLQDIEGLIY